MKKLWLLLVCVAPLQAWADESSITLKADPNRDVVTGRCAMCHSLDYIPMNSVFLDRKGWTGTVNKMVKVMGAPIPEKEIPVIVDYLTKYYGK